MGGHGDRNMHRCGECIVRGLPHVAMIIGVHRVLRSDRATQHLDRTVRDDFVGVHVGLGA